MYYIATFYMNLYEPRLSVKDKHYTENSKFDLNTMRLIT